MLGWCVNDRADVGGVPAYPLGLSRGLSSTAMKLPCRGAVWARLTARPHPVIASGRVVRKPSKPVSVSPRRASGTAAFDTWGR